MDIFSIDWISFQSIRTQELSTQAKDVPATRDGGPGIPVPTPTNIDFSIKNATEVEPYLEDAIQRGASLDLNKVIDNLK